MNKQLPGSVTQLGTSLADMKVNNLQLSLLLAVYWVKVGIGGCQWLL